MDVKAEKKALRGATLARRDSLDTQYRIEASLAAASHGEVLDIGPGDVVSGFLPMRSEIDIRPLMYAMMERGAALCVPAILDKTTIVFRRLVRGAPLIDMGFGTFGPGPEAEIMDPTLMLMPLVAFDARGIRLGYGAGYYDRAIGLMRAGGLAPRLVGTAFDCQQADRVPDEAHDVPLPAVLTESGLRNLGKNGG